MGFVQKQKQFHNKNIIICIYLYNNLDVTKALVITRAKSFVTSSCLSARNVSSVISELQLLLI